MLGLLLCGTILGNPTIASTSGSTSLFDVYKKAVFFDAQYLKARAQHGASREMLKQARAGLLPNITVEYQKSHTRQDTISSDSLIYTTGVSNYPSESYTITLTQPLFHWDTYIDLSVAELEMRRADSTLAFEKSELITRVLQRYLEALSAQDTLELAVKEEEAVEKQFHLAKARYGAQVGRKADFFDARARFATRQANTTVARNDLYDTLESLREVSGLPLTGLANLKSIELVLPDPFLVETWVEMAEKDNLEVLQQRLSVEIARQEYRKQRSARMPTLDLVARQYHVDSGGTEFGGGREIESRTAEVRLQLPIYQGGRVSSRIRQTSRLHQAAMDELNHKLRAVGRQTRAAFNDIGSAIDQVHSLEQAVEAQQLVVRTKNAGFPDVYNRLEVLDSERDLFTARRDLSQAKYDYILNTLRLKYLTGRLKEKDVWLIDRWLLDQQEEAVYELLVEGPTDEKRNWMNPESR